MDVFPVDLIYRPWKHAEGQVGADGETWVWICHGILFLSVSVCFPAVVCSVLPDEPRRVLLC